MNVHFHLRHDRSNPGRLLPFQRTEHPGNHTTGFFASLLAQLWFLLSAPVEFLADIVSQFLKTGHMEFLTGFVKLPLYANLPILLALVMNLLERLLVEIILRSKRMNPLLRYGAHPLARDGERLHRIMGILLALLTGEQIRFDKRLCVIEIENIR